MPDRFRCALLLGAALCAPLAAAAQAVRGAAPVTAPVIGPALPGLPAHGRLGEALALPALPGLGPAALSASLPAPAALTLPSPEAAALPLALAAPAAVAAPDAPRVIAAVPAHAADRAGERDGRPAGSLASLHAAQTLPRLAFDGGVAGKPQAEAVSTGPGPCCAGRSGLSRLADGAPRAAARSVPPPRPSALQRLRAGAWGVTLGFTSLAAGALLMLTPGPGTPFLLVGLYLLSGRFAWAARGLDKVRAFVNDKVFHGDRRRMAKLERRLGM